jgi:hypothetical protein
VHRPALLAALVTGSVAGAVAQAPSRTATTVEAILAHPVFYHGRQVVIRAEVRQDETFWRLAAAGEQPVLVLWRGRPAGDGLLELRGEVVDVGRLEPQDPRFGSVDTQLLMDRFSRGSWPARNQLYALAGATGETATPPAAPSVRAIALDPARYAEQTVTVTGRFRGRNLYGDLPEAPGKSRWDFVLQSADGAVWVTGMRPRGTGFNLDPTARVDTNQWLQVRGVVRHEGALVHIEAQTMATAKAETTTPVQAPPAPPYVPPTPEVVFSTPLTDETDVPSDTTVRIQFSRDMDPRSFTGRVRVNYFAPPGGRPAPPPPAFTTVYQDDVRALEIRFKAPLERFSTVEVHLLEGIVARGGGTLKPWTASFSVGAR